MLRPLRVSDASVLGGETMQSKLKMIESVFATEPAKKKTLLLDLSDDLLRRDCLVDYSWFPFRYSSTSCGSKEPIKCTTSLTCLDCRVYTGVYSKTLNVLRNPRKVRLVS